MKRRLLFLAVVAGLSIAGLADGAQAVKISTGSGYWMLSEDGRVYNFGDAPRCPRPDSGNVSMSPYLKTVDITADPVQQGYWVLIDHVNGGIASTRFHHCPRDTDPFFNAGDAHPILAIVMDWEEHATSISMTPDGRGGIFAFGDVPFHGSLGASPPASPIVSVAVMP
jgi:hypothetical protein